MSDTADICHDAVLWMETLEQADADKAIDTLIERLIAILRRDPRMPPLAAQAWRDLFASVTSLSRDELGELIGGKGSIDEAVDVIIEALTAGDGEVEDDDEEGADAPEQPQPGVSA